MVSSLLTNYLSLSQIGQQAAARLSWFHIFDQGKSLGFILTTVMTGLLDDTVSPTAPFVISVFS
jgi:hypothetical protein